MVLITTIGLFPFNVERGVEGDNDLEEESSNDDIVVVVEDVISKTILVMI